MTAPAEVSGPPWRLFDGCWRGLGYPFARCPECGTAEVRIVSMSKLFESFEGPRARFGLRCTAGHGLGWAVVSHKDGVALAPDEPEVLRDATGSNDA